MKLWWPKFGACSVKLEARRETHGEEGSEEAEGGGSRFLGRVGVQFSFPFAGRWAVMPTVALDFINGEIPDYRAVSTRRLHPALKDYLLDFKSFQAKL